MRGHHLGHCLMWCLLLPCAEQQHGGFFVCIELLWGWIFTITALVTAFNARPHIFLFLLFNWEPYPALAFSMLIQQYIFQTSSLVEVMFPVQYHSVNNRISTLISQLKSWGLKTGVSHISDLSRNFTCDFLEGGVVMETTTWKGFIRALTLACSETCA